MPVKVRPAEEADFAEVSSFIMRSFEDDDLNHVIYPWRSSPEGLKISEENLRKFAGKAKYSHFLAAIDEDSGEIAAFSIWDVNSQNPYERDAENEGVNKPAECEWLDKWPDPRNRKFGEYVFNGMSKHRKNLAESQGPHCHLGLLVTNPKFFRKGAGRALIEYGTDIADKNGWPCIVEASPYASERQVYHRFGFQEVEKMVFEIGEDFAGLLDQPYWNLLMVRPAAKAG